MEIKIKILKILPYWLIFLILAVSVQTAGFLLSKNTVLGQGDDQPQVLGATTVLASGIRGDAPVGAESIVQISEPDLSVVSAKSFLVFDLASGQVLLQKNADQKLAIASLTKLMTALVAYSNITLNQTFKISGRDALSVKPDLGLAAGDEVKVLDIFNAMLIGSCNDAALALAHFTASSTGTEFVGLMNDQAQALGMRNSSFQNPMGFDNGGNYSTANDLKILITKIEQLSAFTDLGRRTSYEFQSTAGKNFSTPATNKLLVKYPDIQAIKTGFTNEASGAMATKIQISGHQVVILVLDSQNREGDTLKLKAAVEPSFNWE